MNKIKKTYIVLLGILAVGFTSCDYLDTKPSGQVIPESVSEYRAMLVKGYKLFPAYKHLLSVRADEAFPFADGSAYDDFISVALWDESNPGTYTETYPWLRMYNVIFYANSVIESNMTEERNSGEDTEDQLKAEAFLLRAYAHFELLNLYAKPYAAATAATDRGIPLSTKIDIEQHFVPQTVEEVYTQILQDIQQGEALMQVEDQPAATKYRFSKRSAKALEARVRLYRSEWKEALEAAEALLPCELEDMNESSSVLPYYYNSKESILALERVNGENNHIVNGKLYMLPNLMDKYDKEKDLRMRKYSLRADGVYIAASEHKDNMIVTFRSGEIYLIAAEAAAHLDGKLDAAKDYLKQLMVKRLTPDYYAVKAAEVDGMDRQALLVEIADERARELSLEGHRWYDLRRTDRPQITKVYTDKNGEEQTAVLQSDDVRYTIRFPQEAIEHNPDLNN